MMRRGFTEEQRDWCVKFLQETPLGQRGRFDGMYFQQLFGLLGQVVICDLVGHPRPQRTGFDGGVDLTINGKTFDVKVVIRASDAKKEWMVNLPEPQAKYQTDYLLFMNYNKEEGTFTILGSIKKKLFLEKATHHSIGSSIERDNGTTLLVQGCGFYDLAIKQLESIDTKEDLQKTGEETL